jgi:hypothetical protein
VYFFPDILRRVPYSLAAVLLLLAVCRSRGKKAGLDPGQWVPLAGTLLAALLLSQIVTQPGSIFRSFSFLASFGVLLALTLWTTVFRLLPRHRFVLLTSCLLPVSLTGVVAWQGIRHVPVEHVAEALQFACGQMSLADGFRSRGVTSDLPVKLRAVIGPEARVYTLDLVCFSMAPGCELESFVSFALHPEYHTILFESPERARAALQAQGANYFLINLDPASMFGLDVLQFSPLFQPGNLEKHFAVRWQSAHAVLLTWPGPDTVPISSEFLERYAREDVSNRFKLRDLYRQLGTIYESNDRRGYPVWRDPALPAVKGWQ